MARTPRSCARSRQVTTTSSGPPSAVIRLRDGSGGRATGRSFSRRRRPPRHRRSRGSPGPWVGPFHWDSRRFRTAELKRLMTFPDGFEVLGSRRERQLQLGNAVPPLLGRQVAEGVLSEPTRARRGGARRDTSAASRLSFAHGVFFCAARALSSCCCTVAADPELVARARTCRRLPGRGTRPIPARSASRCVTAPMYSRVVEERCLLAMRPGLLHDQLEVGDPPERRLVQRVDPEDVHMARVVLEWAERPGPVKGRVAEERVARVERDPALGLRPRACSAARS